MEQPSGPLEQSLWLYLERAKRLWNGPPAFWNGRKALAALVLFVGRRYYLRPNPPFGLGPPAGYWNARSASGAIWNRACGSIWNGLRPFGPPAGLSAVTRVRVCGGNAMNVL